MQKAAEKFNKAMGDLAVACVDAATAFVEFFRATAENLSEVLKPYLKECETAFKIRSMPNSRVKHLALHSKKKRVRKKNINRLLRGIK